MPYEAPRRSHLAEDKECPQCGSAFSPDNRAQVYCTTRCRTAAGKARQKARGGPRSMDMSQPRSCGICGNDFFPKTNRSSNAKYCSDDCRVEAVRRDQKRFRDHNPSAQALYNRARSYATQGDTLMGRVLKKYPNLPRCCEACGLDEPDILELAHRPGFERKGAHRLIRFYEPHMIWVLCPNDHTRLDKGLATPEELGLKFDRQPA